MEQAKRRVLETLIVVSLFTLIYYQCISNVKAVKTEEGSINLTNSTTAGVNYVVEQMLKEADKESTESNNIDPVGTPLENATILEDGTIIPADFEPYEMYVNVGWLNVRSAPNTEEDNVIGKLNINDLVKVIGEAEDNWIIIEYNDSVAYISSEYTQDTLPELDTYNNEWTGEKLNRYDGTADGPSGKETYYNLNMSKCIYYMNCLGYYGYVWERSDGCKMFGDAIMVACDLKKHPKGSYVMTSLGKGIVVDTGTFTTNGSGVDIDIAVTW